MAQQLGQPATLARADVAHNQVVIVAQPANEVAIIPATAAVNVVQAAVAKDHVAVVAISSADPTKPLPCLTD
jgi:Trk K+ transport system NAD-binding subunit